MPPIGNSKRLRLLGSQSTTKFIPESTLKGNVPGEPKDYRIHKAYANHKNQAIKTHQSDLGVIRDIAKLAQCSLRNSRIFADLKGFVPGVTSTNV